MVQKTFHSGIKSHWFYGIVDPDWPSTPFLTDPADDADNNYDILNFRVATNASTPADFYFKAELDYWMTISANDFLEARLDCNNDGDYIDTEDLYVAYSLSGDTVSFWEGPGTGDGYSFSSYDYGEPTSTNYVYELNINDFQTILLTFFLLRVKLNSCHVVFH